MELLVAIKGYELHLSSELKLPMTFLSLKDQGAPLKKILRILRGF